MNVKDYAAAWDEFDKATGDLDQNRKLDLFKHYIEHIKRSLVRYDYISNTVVKSLEKLVDKLDDLEKAKGKQTDDPQKAIQELIAKAVQRATTK